MDHWRWRVRFSQPYPDTVSGKCFLTSCLSSTGRQIHFWQRQHHWSRTGTPGTRCGWCLQCSATRACPLLSHSWAAPGSWSPRQGPGSGPWPRGRAGGQSPTSSAAGQSWCSVPRPRAGPHPGGTCACSRGWCWRNRPLRKGLILKTHWYNLCFQASFNQLNRVFYVNRLRGKVSWMRRYSRKVPRDCTFTFISFNLPPWLPPHFTRFYIGYF